jgi:hypothetical protein
VVFDLWNHCIELVNLTIEWASKLDLALPGRDHCEIKWYM